MRELVRFGVEEARPAPAELLECQGLPAAGELSPRLRALVDEAFATFSALVDARAVCEDVTIEEFTAVLAPLALAPESLVVGRLYPGAAALALYVATVGDAVPARIRALVAEGALAEGYMLDAVASLSADLLSDRLAGRLAQRLAADGRPGRAVLPYSPGYCGWPTSGQRPLFERLRPGEIAVTLNDSCLMSPIKSVSGVLIAAWPQGHKFRPDFPFCRECRTRDCGPRMASVLKPQKRSAT
jgi:hypothetical protein